MAAYEEVIRSAVGIGLLDVILPFILVFTIVFAMLERSQVLGKARNINALVAFVLGFLAVLATQLLNVINTLLSYLVLALLASLFFSMLLGLAGGAKAATSKGMRAIAGVLFGMATLAGLAQAGVIDSQRFKILILPLLIIAAIIFVIYYIFRKEQTEQEPAKPKPSAPKKLKPEATIDPAEKTGVLWKGDN